MRKASALVSLLLALPFAAALPQLRPPSAQPAPGPRRATPRVQLGSDITVTLLTMGVGEQVWEQFGHNALWFHVQRSPSSGGPVDVVYNWGIFDFRQPHFIARFLKAQMLYSMGGYSYESTLEDYRVHDRAMWAQELDLTNEQKVALRDFVVWNSQPENANYYYDYYRDNCSTRVRDALDRVLGGAIKAAFATRPTGHSYRWHTLRLTQKGPLLATGIDIGLGRPADREISAWEEMFLPMKLRDYLRELRVTDGRGLSRPLVKNERVLLVTARHAEPTAPPRWTRVFLAIGLGVAIVFALVGWRAARGGTAARYLAATLFSLWAFVLGVLGVVLVLLWTATHHVFAYRNENLLIFNPLWLALAVLAPMTAVKGRVARTTRVLALVLAAMAVVAALIHAVGLSRQRNIEIIALALPPILVLLLAVRRGTRRAAPEVPHHAELATADLT